VFDLHPDDHEKADADTDGDDSSELAAYRKGAPAHGLNGLRDAHAAISLPVRLGNWTVAWNRCVVRHCQTLETVGAWPSSSLPAHSATVLRGDKVSPGLLRKS
jgi:hypothetical protein